MPENSLLQLGAVAILFLVGIREFFSYLKTRNGGNGGDNESVLQELRKTNNNHLHSVEDAIREGNKELIKAVSDGNLRIVEALGEIKGKLSR
ncbi:MAG: hypothetical protein WD883_00015 [Candidatus Colwellbacteria bacterium]